MGCWIEAQPTPRPLHLAASRLGPIPPSETSVLDGLAVTLADWAEREPTLAVHLRAADAAIEAALAARDDIAELRAANCERALVALRRASAASLVAPTLAAKLRRKAAEIDWALAIAADPHRDHRLPSLLADGRRASKHVLPARSVAMSRPVSWSTVGHRPRPAN